MAPPSRRTVLLDLMLCSSRDVSEGVKARDGLEAAYADGRLDRAAFRASVQRVIDLRRSLQD